MSSRFLFENLLDEMIQVVAPMLGIMAMGIHVPDVCGTSFSFR
jgi:hypothetical protein